MPRADPVLIFDLDGTVLRRNSFPYWTMALLTGGRISGLRARATLSWRVQQLLLRRKLGRLGHDTLLRELQQIWARAGDPGGEMAARLQARLLRLARRNLRLVLRSVANLSVDSVLATAAAAEYAEPLARELGFLHVLATPAGATATEPCNRGEHKRDRVLALLDTQGWTQRPRIFFNDHMDDLPLMQVSQAVCWFGSGKALRTARAAAPGTRFVSCRGLNAEEMQQTLAHIRQSLETAQLARSASFAGSRARTFS